MEREVGIKDFLFSTLLYTELGVV